MDSALTPRIDEEAAPPPNTPRIRIPLSLALMVPFTLIVAAAVGLMGYMGYRSGWQVSNELAGTLQEEIAASVRADLDRYLETPHLINAINADAIRMGMLDP